MTRGGKSKWTEWRVRCGVMSSTSPHAKWESISTGGRDKKNRQKWEMTKIMGHDIRRIMSGGKTCKMDDLTRNSRVSHHLHVRWEKNHVIHMLWIVKKAMKNVPTLLMNEVEKHANLNNELRRSRVHNSPNFKALSSIAKSRREVTQGRDF